MRKSLFAEWPVNIQRDDVTEHSHRVHLFVALNTDEIAFTLTKPVLQTALQSGSGSKDHNVTVADLASGG